MSKLLILKGLPASGKSTYAKELARKGWKRLNKDEIRIMVHDSVFNKDNEAQTKFLQKQMAKSLLSCGYNVVIDDTNFAYENFWKEIADEVGSSFEIKFFDVPLMECIERDSKRGDKSVGAKVIQRMYDKYLKPKEPEYSDDKQNCYIFDIDGTLAKMNGRSPYDYTKVDTDIPNHNITMIARLLAQSGLPILVVSGRDGSCMPETHKWLHDNNIPFNLLLMRSSGDNRNDAIIKKEIYEREIKPYYNVLAVFDDRNRVVDMWRSLGITTLQVDYGNF